MIGIWQRYFADKIINQLTYRLNECANSIRVNFIQQSFASTKKNNIQNNNKLADKPIDLRSSDSSLIQTIPYTNPLWFDVRKELTERFTVAHDKAWFSKLDCSYNEEKKEVTVYAPSKFVAGWVEKEYGTYI